MKTLFRLLALALLSPPAHANDSARIVRAALDQIAWTKQTGDQTTDCSIYVARTLDRAGLSVGGFSSNEFDQAMARHLPWWKHAEFTNESPDVLRAFLNSAPDGTVFLAQWPRVGRSGHTAIVEKVGIDQYVIFQAQQGLSLPHEAPARISQLVYAGGRASLRLFFE